MATMKDIRSQMGVPPFIQGNGSAPAAGFDELAQAIQQRKALLGSRLLDETGAQLAAQAQLDERKLRLEARKMELEEMQTEERMAQLAEQRQAARQQGQSQGQDFMGAVVQLLMEDRSAQREAAERQQAQQQALWKEMLELARAPAASRPQQEALPSLAERVQELKAVMGLVADLQPKQTAPQGLTARELIDLEMAKAKIEREHQETQLNIQLRMRELQGREGAQAAELQLRREAADAERKRNEQMAGLLAGMAPAVTGWLQKQVTGEAPAPETTANVVEEEATEEHSCPRCHRGFLTRVGATGTVCPYTDCKQYIDLTQPPPQ